MKLKITLIALVFLCIGLYFGTPRSHPVPPLSNIEDLFSQTLPDSQGQLHNLSIWKGKPLLINFWASWCNPCIEEIPELVTLQTNLTQERIQFLGIALDNPTNITRFMSEQNVPYPIYVSDSTGVGLARKLGNESGGIPFTILIDSNAVIKKTYLGRLNMSEVRADIEALLNTP